MAIGKILCSAALLSLVACADKAAVPTNTLNNAEQAMQRARQANAYEFASFEITAAERKLNRARDLAGSDDSDDRREARKLAEQVVVDARYAEAKARLTRTEGLQSEVEQTIEQLRSDAERDTGGVR